MLATNILDTNSPPRPGEAGSPCVFVVIYRVSPAKLSDCICLHGALLVHTSHPWDSELLQTHRPTRDACPAEVSCCLHCVRVVAVQWPLGGGNVKLQGEVFWHLSEVPLLDGLWTNYKEIPGIVFESFPIFFNLFSRPFFPHLWIPRGLWASSSAREKRLARGHLSRSGIVRYTSLRSFSSALPPALISSSTLDPIWLSETFASSFPRLSSSPSWAAWQHATNL